jgi:hypothetical protein
MRLDCRGAALLAMTGWGCVSVVAEALSLFVIADCEVIQAHTSTVIANAVKQSRRILVLDCRGAALLAMTGWGFANDEEFRLLTHFPAFGS